MCQAEGRGTLLPPGARAPVGWLWGSAPPALLTAEGAGHLEWPPEEWGQDTQGGGLQELVIAGARGHRAVRPWGNRNTGQWG